MKLSIVIVSWNVKDLLKKCLKSIFDFAPDFEFEIIVIDNASADGTVEMLKQNFTVIPSERIREPRNPLRVDNTSASFTAKGFLNFADEYIGSVRNDKSSIRMTKIKLISNDKNLGFAKANNQGIAQAKGDYILLLNPDTEFIEEALSKSVAKMEQDKKIGVLGCQLLNSDKTIQPSVRHFPRIRDIIVILLKLHKLFPSLLDRYLARDFEYTAFTPPQLSPQPSPLKGEGVSWCVEVDQVMGAFFLARREVFNQIGLLDEKFFIWFEEVDFCRRAKNARYKILYYPDARIVHHGGQSFAQAGTWRKQKCFFKSALRYFMK